MMKHIPVLLDAVMDTLGNVHGLRILDATFGAGGYTRAFLDGGASVVAFDRDPNVFDDANFIKHQFGERFEFVARPFSTMGELNDAFDAIVFDLGISSMQIDNPERGFSFRADAALDMRMSGAGPTICDMFEQWSAGDIAKILREYGDVRPAVAIANAIKQKVPKTTFELRDLIHNPRDVAPVFQALRIALNDEMGELERALMAVPDLLKVGGKCICVTFHSLEDRIVKNTFRDWTGVAGDPRLPNVSRPRFELIRARTPDKKEIDRNSRARSAHMRGVVKSY
ncbi:MAG: 16S rRNA (cytosine(1402)-N(4))-methyltransferase RsmH [Alphaproteobacteria bacterium]|nr:16S rRNA (cytosine(1402)-N(4))-methyltransferase RsmH [Alphaproteobacteria bacterium]